jgi:hypothetical protein
MKKKPYQGEHPAKPVVEETVGEVTIKLIKVQSLVDAHLLYDGQVSGRHYEWHGAGAIVDVDEQDVSELLSKRRGKKPCCGEQEQPKIFQLA